MDGPRGRITVVGLLWWLFFGRRRRLTTLERIVIIAAFVVWIAHAAVYWLERLTF
jgi:hypothetical protein